VCCIAIYSDKFKENIEVVSSNTDETVLKIEKYGNCTNKQAEVGAGELGGGSPDTSATH